MAKVAIKVAISIPATPDLGPGLEVLELEVDKGSPGGEEVKFAVTELTAVDGTLETTVPVSKVSPKF